jgi:hypothetical protein
MDYRLDGRRVLRWHAFLIVPLLLLGLFSVDGLRAAMLSASESGIVDQPVQRLNKPLVNTPCQELRVHKVGNILLSVTNYGIFGNQNEAIIDPETNQLAPSCEYPAGSGIEYLFQGALWVGAIVNEDTLVTTGHDGWQHVFEMFPTSCDDGGHIVKRSTRKTDDAYSPDAISEADYIAVYTDTLTDQSYVAPNPDDGRPHIPLGIEITQKSYSWSYSYAEDFVLFDFLIKNIGTSDLRKLYIGVYIDADVYHPTNSGGFTDDICGFRRTYPSPVGCTSNPIEDTINVAWIADNDGDPESIGGSRAFTDRSPIAVTGTRVVRTPNPDLKYSFNWWVSNGNAAQDWGPVRAENNRDLGTGGLGTPAGDPNKYFFMSNNEFDYDELWSAINFTADGWLPPISGLAADLADGYDTRYLLSFGPFDIEPHDSLPLTLAYIGGDHFHANPDDFKRFFDATDPQVFHDKLDFSDLATNAVWASKVYDNPGVDTDNNNYAGEKYYNPCIGDSVWITGDGVPDFAGPPPPPAPLLRFEAAPREITLRWNGYDSETAQDPFSGKQDFEGYRIYLGDQPLLSKFALLTSYDHLDFDRYRLNLGFDPPRWELKEVPFSLDSLVQIYEQGDSLNAGIPDFTPDMYPSASDSLVWYEIVSGQRTETAYYFRPHGYNRSHLGGRGEIRKVYPDASDSEMVWVDALNDYVYAKYEYAYTISGLLPSQPAYMSVSTMDYGYPLTGLAPLESSPLANAIEVYPIWSNKEVESQDLKVAVFPNPYKINGGYLEAGYEKLTSQDTSPERARRIHFANLPAKAKIRIYTLDGDLVRELDHPCDCNLQEGESMMAWDLISRNTQAVVSGIYLYTIESDAGNQVGKFVIIK